jgi:hypothetical protein
MVVSKICIIYYLGFIDLLSSLSAYLGDAALLTLYYSQSQKHNIRVAS